MQATPGDRFRAMMSTREARGSFALGVLATLATGAMGYWWFPSTLPTILSTDLQQGVETVRNLTLIAAPVVGVVLGIAGYSLLNMRRGDTPPTEDGPGIRTNSAVVLTWAVVSSLLCTVAIVWGLVEMSGGETRALATTQRAMVVEVTGSQWVWTYRYPEQGVETTELVLPVNQPVLFKVTSVDVIHSFWPVQLGIKVDANKGQITTALTVPDNLGGIDVHCAELCGLYHSQMANPGMVVTVNDFNAWIGAQKQVNA